MQILQTNGTTKLEGNKMHITAESPKRRPAAYAEEQQEKQGEQQENSPGSTQSKRYKGGVQKESRLRRAGK